jgi:hypothetical protein
MSVILTEDCVMRADGTFVCWDRDEQAFYALKKTNIAAEDITQREMAELIKKIGKPNKKKGYCAGSKL